MSIRRLVLVMLVSASPASAHAVLERAIPSAGGEVAMSPPEIVLTFNGESGAFVQHNRTAQPKKCGRNAWQAPHRIGAQPATERGTPHIATWDLHHDLRTTSADTHKTEGSYRFTVAH